MQNGPSNAYLLNAGSYRPLLKMDIFGIGNVIGSGVSAAANAAEAAKNRDFQAQMSSTAHQRQVADMRAAGLNPIMSGMGGSGASAPSGSQASIPDMSNIGSQMGSSALNAANRKIAKQNAVSAKAKAEIEKERASRKGEIVDKETAGTNPFNIMDINDKRFWSGLGHSAKAIWSGIKGIQGNRALENKVNSMGYDIDKKTGKVSKRNPVTVTTYPPKKPKYKSGFRKRR